MNGNPPAVVRLPDLLAEPETARALLARVPAGAPVRLRGGDVEPTPAFTEAFMEAAAAAHVPSVIVEPHVFDDWRDAARRHRIALT